MLVWRPNQSWPLRASPAASVGDEQPGSAEAGSDDRSLVEQWPGVENGEHLGMRPANSRDNGGAGPGEELG
jgi:hypothetical protein